MRLRVAKRPPGQAQCWARARLDRKTTASSVRSVGSLASDLAGTFCWTSTSSLLSLLAIALSESQPEKSEATSNDEADPAIGSSRLANTALRTLVVPELKLFRPHREPITQLSCRRRCDRRTAFWRRASLGTELIVRASATPLLAAARALVALTV